MHQRSYFVSYVRVPDHGGGFGFSHAVVDMTVPSAGPMTTQIFEVLRDYLKAQNPDHGITILSFQELARAETTVSV